MKNEDFPTFGLPVTAIFGEVKMLKSEPGEIVFITDNLPENEFDDCILKLQGILGQDSIINTITVL